MSQFFVFYEAAKQKVNSFVQSCRKRSSDCVIQGTQGSLYLMFVHETPRQLFAMQLVQLSTIGFELCIDASPRFES